MADSDGPATTPPEVTASVPAQPLDPVAVIRSKPYLMALVLAAVMGIPISAIAYGFLALVAETQRRAVHRRSAGADL